MEVSVFDLISVRQMPTGRRRFALRQVKRAVQELQNDGSPLADATLSGLIDACDKALVHDEETARMQAAWAQQQRQAANQLPGPTRAVALDNLIDRTISGIDGKLVSEAMSYPATHPKVEEIEGLRAFLLPMGVAGITRSTHVESLHLIHGLLERAQARADALAEYGATNLVSRLKTLFADFKAELDKEKSEKLSANQVRAADREGNRLLRNIIVQILAATLEQEDQSLMTVRQALLTPILTQDAAMLRYNRANRRAVDVNPDTGEELDEEPEAAAA